ncbi:MAG: acyltransferase [Acidimicrobiales bacterium]|nr:acyltransferase [Acidimicrobiales bacterium]RZV41506.1 MAG: acyltransferase [Acidimicrobiales bacterium]
MARLTIGDVVLSLWESLHERAAIKPGSTRASRFASFGSKSIICFPPQVLFNEHAIVIGQNTAIGPHCSLTVGMAPGQELIAPEILRIGDRCVIGRGCSIAAHLDIEIGDDVFFGPNVFVTDQNHANTDQNAPIGKQLQAERAVKIGSRSWLGTGVVVTPGVTIGEGVMVGANSVVTRDLPDGCVAAGAPAKVLA